MKSGSSTTANVKLKTAVTFFEKGSAKHKRMLSEYLTHLEYIVRQRFPLIAVVLLELGGGGGGGVVGEGG